VWVWGGAGRAEAQHTWHARKRGGATGWFEQRQARHTACKHSAHVPHIVKLQPPLPTPSSFSPFLIRFLPAGLKSLFFKDWTMAPGLRLKTRGTTPTLAPTTQPAAAAAAVADDAGAVVPAGSSSSSSSGLRYCLTFRKQPQVRKPPPYCLPPPFPQGSPGGLPPPPPPQAAHPVIRS
jgi:hypothetical protein